MRPSAYIPFALALACSSPDGGPTSLVLDETAVQHGAFGPRSEALAAFNGTRPPVTLSMTTYTVEGVAIHTSLETTPGRAIFSIDERADGGGIRVDTLMALVLVRFVPSRWEGNVEIEKERFELVGPTENPDPNRSYFLTHPRCVTEQCSTVF